MARLKPCPFKRTSVGHAVGYAGGGQVAFDRGKNFTGEMGAEFVVGVAAEPCAKILCGLAIGQVLAQQALDGFGNQRCRAAIADRARDGGVLCRRLRQGRSSRRR